MKEVATMKFLFKLGHILQAGRFPRAMLMAAALLAFCFVSSSHAGNSGAGQRPANLCTKTSNDLLDSCEAGAESDFSLAIANCDNLPTPQERRACQEQARQDKKAATELCQAQFEARQQICEELGRGPYNPVINPENFVNTIDNPYFPLKPGTIYIYEGQTEKGLEHVEVRVTNETKEIFGVTCVVVKDTGTVNGELAEDTIDWYAQDRDGNVWYFGENSLSYEDGLIVSLEGSWTAGVDGAKPGIIMKAHPAMGDLYRQEFAPGVAEDMAQVLSLHESVTVSAGSFTNCVMTKDFSPIEPDTIEHKLYAPGVGNVRIVDVETGNHLDLISKTP
jgi:hypothetical protein